jgi:hypothetical protein
MQKLDVKFRYMHEGISVDNHVMGIQFTCAKSLPQEDLEEATPHFDVHIDLSEIHVISYLFTPNNCAVLLLAILQSIMYCFVVSVS